jgi:pSer/pThr/pTyr-binding forkhead associated (FHA) protein
VSVAAERDTLLIGRTSQSRGVAPDIALDFDSAVSHRHALLTRANGSGWTIRDIGSANGTRLNGKDIQPMVDVPLNPGDRVTLGHWTCLTLCSEQSS